MVMIMKRLAALAIAALVLILPVAADSDFGSFGMTGGYSSKDNTALMGFYGTYQYTSEASAHISLGFGTHADFAFGLNHKDELMLSMGYICGFGIEASITDTVSLNLTIGPAVMVETGITSASVGIGVACDTAFSFYFNKENSMGLTAGATVYPQFFVLDDGRPDRFSIAASGYIGMSMRFPATLSMLAIPAVSYLLY